MATETQSLLDGLDVRIESPRQTVRESFGRTTAGTSQSRAPCTGRTRLVLMDEPTAALGVTETRRVEEADSPECANADRAIPHRQPLTSIRSSARRPDLRPAARKSWSGIRRTSETNGDEIVAMITGLR